MVRLMVTSSKKAYATLLSAVPRAPAPADPYLCRGHSNTQRQIWLRLCGVSCCVQGFVWALGASLAGMGFDSKHDFAPLLPCRGFSFALGRGVYFLVGSNTLLSMAVRQWVVILEFSQEKMNIHPSTPPSWSKSVLMVYHVVLCTCWFQASQSWLPWYQRSGSFLGFCKTFDW